MKLLTANRSHINFIILFSLVAFLLHFTWENVQCPLFYIHGTYDATWFGMTQASVGDVFITWFIYLFGSMYQRKFRWFRDANIARPLLVSLIIAAAIGVFIEIYSLRAGRWGYNDNMPVLFSVGLVPVIQLIIITPLTALLSERLMKLLP